MCTALRQGTPLGIVRALILERQANLTIASPLLPYFRVLRPGRYLKRRGRRLAEEGFSHEDALILSYTSFGFDTLEKACGVESVLTNDLRMKDRYAHGFPRIKARFATL
jgi:hypothetical protein